MNPDRHFDKKKSKFRMSYPKQTGYIPPYSGPAPISISSEPENLDEAVKRGHIQKIHYFIKNNPDQINLQGFHGQTPLHMICMRADDILAQVIIPNFRWSNITLAI